MRREERERRQELDDGDASDDVFFIPRTRMKGSRGPSTFNPRSNFSAPEAYHEDTNCRYVKDKLDRVISRSRQTVQERGRAPCSRCVLNEGHEHPETRTCDLCGATFRCDIPTHMRTDCEAV